MSRSAVDIIVVPQCALRHCHGQRRRAPCSTQRNVQRAGDTRHATCGAQRAARDILALRCVLQLRDRRARRRAVACDRRGCALVGGARDISHGALRMRQLACCMPLFARCNCRARSPVATSAQWPASLVSARHGIPHGMVYHAPPGSHAAQYPARHGNQLSELGIPPHSVSHTAWYPAWHGIPHGMISCSQTPALPARGRGNVLTDMVYSTAPWFPHCATRRT